MSTLISKNIQIGADGTASNNFTLYQPATPDGTLRLGNGNTGITSSLLTLTSAGNLGIGTSSPSVRLHVSGGNARIDRVSNASILTLGGSPSDNWEGDIEFVTSNNQTNWRVSSNRVVSGSFTLTPSTAAGGNTFTTPAFMLTPSGNLGLGVTPSAWNSTYNAFDIGGGSISGRTSTNNQVDIASNGFRNSGGTWVYKFNGPAVRFTADGSGSGYQWYTAPSGTAGDAISFTQAATLTAAGDFLVGTTTSNGRLTVSQSGTGSAADISTSNTSTTNVIALYRPNNGNMLSFNNNGSIVGSISVTSTTAYNITSDVRLKSDLGQAKQSRIGDVIIHDFLWKANGTQDRGVFAQELAEIIPNAVTKGKNDDEYWQVDYSKLIPDLIVEIQSLRKRVAELEAK